MRGGLCSDSIIICTPVLVQLGLVVAVADQLELLLPDQLASGDDLRAGGRRVLILGHFVQNLSIDCLFVDHNVVFKEIQIEYTSSVLRVEHQSRH